MSAERPSYDTRLLPPEEWHRLVGTELETLVPKLDPAQTQIVVVERGGVLVGTWAVLQMVHVEGLWIAPAYRGKSPGIVRRLVQGMQMAAQQFGARVVWTGAASASVAQLIRHAGGTRVPFESYILPLQREA
jgi:hypothetical protein